METRYGNDKKKYIYGKVKAAEMKVLRLTLEGTRRDKIENSVLEIYMYIYVYVLVMKDM